MKNDYLLALAKRILSEVPDGLTKVRFAKIVYFTHKLLVKKNQAGRDDLGFIRMPLGPVPVGFKEISDPEIKIEEVHSPALSYDKQVYKIVRSKIVIDAVQSEVKGILKTLLGLSTSQLVDFSHKEHSWINHLNGQEYFLDNEDLKISLPNVKGEVGGQFDNQKLQAKLVEGMLEEIVDDSTALEYPDYGGK